MSAQTGARWLSHFDEAAVGEGTDEGAALADSVSSKRAVAGMELLEVS